MVPFPEPMRMWTISTRVNKPENDDPLVPEPIKLLLPPSPMLRYGIRGWVAFQLIKNTIDCDVQFDLADRR
jgi:hypothetical protein